MKVTTTTATSVKLVIDASPGELHILYGRLTGAAIPGRDAEHVTGPIVVGIRDCLADCKRDEPEPDAASYHDGDGNEIEFGERYDYRVGDDHELGNAVRPYGSRVIFLSDRRGLIWTYPGYLRRAEPAEDRHEPGEPDEPSEQPADPVSVVEYLEKHASGDFTWLSRASVARLLLPVLTELAEAKQKLEEQVAVN